MTINIDYKKHDKCDLLPKLEMFLNDLAIRKPNVKFVVSGTRSEKGERRVRSVDVYDGYEKVGAICIDQDYNKAESGDLYEVSSPKIVKKFKFNYTLSPLATSGDFRIDIGEQARNEIIQHYEEQFQERLSSAMRDVWDRLHDCLKHMSERLTSEEDGTRKKFHGTLLTNARELVDLLSRLNVTQDPQLEQARRDLSAALLNTDIDALKDSDYVRENVKQKVDAIINKFNW